jgi:hypothetical protein
MLMRNLLVATALAGLSLSPSYGCAPTSVDGPAKIRELQTLLMVSMLQCQVSAKANLVPQYNNFITRNKTTLQSQNRALRAYFQQTSSRGGDAAYDQFTTRLANAYAGRASAPNYCDTAVRIAAAVDAVSSEHLAEFATATLPENLVCLAN